jgi:hypothetical protein
MFSRVFARMLLLAVVAFGMAGMARADATWAPPKNSADFTWKYEMGILPSAENLDGPGNTTNDFAYYAGDGSATTDGNVLRMINGKANGNGFYGSDSVGQIWAAQGFTYAAGYTIEARVKIISSESGGAIQLAANPTDTDKWGVLAISDTKEAWGGASYTHDNSAATGYHIFRIAQKEGADNYAIWRDDVEVATGIGAAMSLSGYPQFYFGDGAGTIGGTVDVDYVRFTAGAWSPVASPEPATIILLVSGLVGLLAYAWRKRK